MNKNLPLELQKIEKEKIDLNKQDSLISIDFYKSIRNSPKLYYKPISKLISLDFEK